MLARLAARLVMPAGNFTGKYFSLLWLLFGRLLWKQYHEWAFFNLSFSHCHQDSCTQCLFFHVLEITFSLFQPWTWNPTWWSDAIRQDPWRPWWLIQHLLCWDWQWQTRPKSCLCWSRANCHWWGAHGNLSPTLPPRAADHWQGGCWYTFFYFFQLVINFSVTHFNDFLILFLKNGPTPDFFLFIFGIFKHNSIFVPNQCEKCPSSIWHRESNPRPFEHESTPKTTRPGLPANFLILCDEINSDFCSLFCS